MGLNIFVSILSLFIMCVDDGCCWYGTTEYEERNIVTE